ncbi:MAG: hypothetical protein HQM04_13610, partial [Magnetococcales bacterium]|nr:hypothetical protein [Magnetococcales bacterium]MBF0116061.1 hypothetical protein [Magnetococcales bacterium]
MARYRYSMVYVEKLAPHSFLLFVDDKISTKLRDFSSGREVELGQPVLVQRKSDKPHLKISYYLSLPGGHP